ncbi:hypothetical protein CNO18_13490 [Gordonia sp. 1D]|nr:hypothetical protein CNO18_13490 [Gordonia sp. 1D]
MTSEEDSSGRSSEARLTMITLAPITARTAMLTTASPMRNRLRSSSSGVGDFCPGLGRYSGLG